MILSELDNFLETELYQRKSSDTIFNQYLDWDSDLDLPEGNLIRKVNMKNYIDSYQEMPDVLLVGEAPGPWGTRFSGIPWIGEKHLVEKMTPFSGKQSSKTDLIVKKYSSPFTSRSANVFWNKMCNYYPKFFAWDCVPLFPHQFSDPLNIRNPTNKEICEFTNILDEIVDIIKPKEVVAIGKKAEFALQQNNIKCITIRHPSNGGQTLFKDQISEIMAKY